MRSNADTIRFISSLTCAATLAIGHAEVLEETGFEQSEGYDPDLPWVGQMGWSGSAVADGDAYDDRAAGFVSDLDGLGQQAYLGGRVVPVENDLQRIIKHETFRHFPLDVSDKQVRCSMKILIHVDDPESEDLFGIVLNEFNLPFTLFSVVVNNASGEVVAGSLTNPMRTGKFITFDHVHELSLEIDYANNLWSAFLDNAVILANQPLVSVLGGKIARFGTMIYIWQDSQRSPERGDGNYMLIDDLKIETIEGDAARPALSIVKTSESQGFLRITGKESEVVEIQQSTDLVDWSTFVSLQLPASEELNLPILLSGRNYFRLAAP